MNKNLRKFHKIHTKLKGKVFIPADKSISHRLLLLAALGEEKVFIKNCLLSKDTLATITCLRDMGVHIEFFTNNEVMVQGVGMYGLKEPLTILDAKNSATTARILLGVLASQNFFSILKGDTSLAKRPFQRVLEPLRKMGARIFARKDNHFLPLVVLPNTHGLCGIDYFQKVASAQVKTAILFAGLYAKGKTKVRECYPSRDHTERILQAIGLPILKEGKSIQIEPVSKITLPETLVVPNDVSSAAFFIVLILLVKGSILQLDNIGVNPTRIGLLKVLQKMGAKIEFLNKRNILGEPVSNLIVHASTLKGIKVEKEKIPTLIDEIPILTVAALHAEGDTYIQGLGELRYKEIDRLEAISEEFNKFTKKGDKCVEVLGDDLIIHGRKEFSFASVSARGDHRMAMALAIMALVSDGGEIHETACVDISYPNFFADLACLIK